MPGSYTIDQQHRVVFSRGWGTLAEGELTAHSSALRADPRFEPGFHQIVDLRDVETFNITPVGVRTQTEITPFSKQTPRAFVVASDVAYGMARMYTSSVGGESSSIHIYRDMRDALVWVGLDPSTEWPAGPADRTFDGG